MAVLTLFVSELSAQSYAVIGTGTASNTATSNSPVNIYYRRTVCQMVYTASELSAAGIGVGATISELGWYVTGAPLYAMPDYTIKFKHVTATNVAAALGTTGWTTVKNAFSYQPPAGGWNMITLDNNFVWDGSSNLGVEVCWSQVFPGFNASGQCYIYTVTNGYRYSRTDAAGTSCGLSPATATTTKPQVRLGWVGSGTCTGTPTPGNTTGPSVVTSGTTISLGLQNPTMGNDVTYQWYVSTSSSSGPWTPTGTSTASLSATVTQDSWFYCAVTCPEGPSTGNSNVLHVEVVPVVLVPFTGSNTNPCGTNIALQDHAGSGNYSNNANGYTVLEAGTNATITISGTYWGEGCCDDLYIYSGAGTGGAVLLNPIGNGAGGVSVNYTGADPHGTVHIGPLHRLRRIRSHGHVHQPLRTSMHTGGHRILGRGLRKQPVLCGCGGDRSERGAEREHQQRLFRGSGCGIRSGGRQLFDRTVRQHEHREHHGDE
jgi:hypothetical protein